MRVITLRIPDEVHEKIKRRAAQKKADGLPCSMNIWLASVAFCALENDPEGIDDIIKSLGEEAIRRLQTAVSSQERVHVSPNKIQS